MLKAKPKYYIWFWISYLLILIFLSYIYDGDVLGGLLLNLTRLPVLMLLSYIVFYIVGNKSEWSNWSKGIVIFLITVLGVIISRALFAIFVFPYFYAENYTFTFFNWYRIVSQFIIFVAGLGGYGLLIYYSEKEQWKNRQKQLLEAKRTSELNFLKAQVQPHFLHNTLNGIYNEVIKKSDKAGDMIIKLSELMRFMLHEGKSDFIMVNKEFELIENYIDLELLRFGDKVKVIAEIDDKYLNSKIPPLLLFSLIENSFKHGVSHQVGESFVKYSLWGDENGINFRVINSLHNQSSRTSIPSDGIGLRNIKKQLELIYHDKFDFEQFEEDRAFVSVLKLPHHV